MRKAVEEIGKKGLNWLVLGGFFVICFISISSYVPRALERYYDFDHYVMIHELHFSDIYEGAILQDGYIRRDVLGSGYKTEFNTKLTRVDLVDASRNRVIAEFNRDDFFEPDEDGLLNFSRPVPQDLPIGEYYWTYGWEIDVNGYLKTKNLDSNVFKVKSLEELAENNSIIEDIKTIPKEE